jgi:hypothetical protein
MGLPATLLPLIPFIVPNTDLAKDCNAQTAVSFCAYNNTLWIAKDILPVLINTPSTTMRAQVIGAMGPPGGARNPVDPRFISLFNAFEIQFPSNENLRTIFQVSNFYRCR